MTLLDIQPQLMTWKLDVDGPIENEDHVTEQAMMFMEAYDRANRVNIHMRRIPVSCITKTCLESRNYPKHIISGTVLP